MRETRRLFFKGGVQAEVTGLGRERFFNIAARRELFVTGIGTDRDGRVFFWTTGEDYKKMKPVARKAGVRLFLRKKYGLPFILFRNRRRKPLAAGFVCFFLFLYGMSFFIWDISFEGNLRFTDQTLLHYMETIPVAYGMRKSLVSCEALEESLRNQFAEITWVSAEIRGTRLTVRIKENEAMLSPEEPDRMPCDLAAEKDGIVERCVVRNGLLKVRAGDPVAAGELLVSGTIPIYDDSETLTASHEIRADAEVYARTVYEAEKRLPLTCETRSRTGRVRRGVFFSIFGRTFYFLMPAYGENPWEFFMEESQLKLFEDFYLPVYGGIVTALEYVPYERAYTKAEVSAAKDRYMEEYMEKLEEKGIQILANDGKIEKDESGWKIQGTVTVIEDIAKPVPIPEKHEENQTVNEFN